MVVLGVLYLVFGCFYGNGCVRGGFQIERGAICMVVLRRGEGVLDREPGCGGGVKGRVAVEGGHWTDPREADTECSSRGGQVVKVRVPEGGVYRQGTTAGREVVGGGGKGETVRSLGARQMFSYNSSQHAKAGRFTVWLRDSIGRNSRVDRAVEAVLAAGWPRGAGIRSGNGGRGPIAALLARLH